MVRRDWSWWVKSLPVAPFRRLVHNPESLRAPVVPRAS